MTKSKGVQPRPADQADRTTTDAAMTVEQYRNMAEDLRRTVVDFDYFMQRHVYILDPQAHQKLKWSHWSCHRRFIQAVQQNKYTIVLKARQLGMSWLAIAYGLWLAMYHYGSRVSVFSRREEEASELLERARFIYRNLPDYLRTEVVRANDTQLTFVEDSGLYAFPATEDAGRSQAGTLCILDEWAFHPEGEAQFAAIKPIIDSGTAKLIGISTGNGAGSFYHSVWQAASEGRNNFAPLFFGWRERPDRDDAWYELQKKDYKPHILKQEYPETPEDAFQQGIYSFFAGDYLQVRPLWNEPIRWDFLPSGLRLDPLLEVYKHPQSGRRYVIGMDVAEGESQPGAAQPDCTCINVVDAEANEQVAFLNGRWDITKQATLVDALARQYPGVVGIERNSLGIAVIKKCEELGTPGLFRETPVLRRLGELPILGKHGWHTNISTKPLMLEELEEHLRQGYYSFASKLFLQQAQVFEKYPSGQYSAPRGFRDDSVIATAISLQMRKYLSQAAYEGPRVVKRGPRIRERVAS